MLIAFGERIPRAGPESHTVNPGALPRALEDMVAGERGAVPAGELDAGGIQPSEVQGRRAASARRNAEIGGSSARCSTSWRRMRPV